MTNYDQLEGSIKEIIDELKGICSQNGLSNSADEERIISTVFLYKFLNDKFMFNLSQFSQELNLSIDEIFKNENSELDAFYDTYSQDVAFNKTETIQFLINESGKPKFYEIFDNALISISQNERNEAFNIETADGERKPLFEAVTNSVSPTAKNNFSRSIITILSRAKFDFGDAFTSKFDFYSTIFEYLIKDYNVASGTYAEYFTPQSLSSIIAKILVGLSGDIDACEIYDPSAGSGSLILHLAHELGQESGVNKAIIYGQDISSKSSRYLRINLLLNGMTESLGNVIQGDTLLKPAHYVVAHDPSSGIKKFDFITSNPPFKMDFSSTRDQIDQTWGISKRFFAGIPTIPKKSKKKMPIYLLFIQHILFSLKENGRAAIVVPTGFLSAKSGIEHTLKKHIIENNMLDAIVSMPSDIFANTGTNVSILFINKNRKDNSVFLMDASNFGEKIKDGTISKTVLSTKEIETIIDTIKNREVVSKLSCSVNIKEIEEYKFDYTVSVYFPVDYQRTGLNSASLVEEIQKKKGKIINIDNELINLSLSFTDQLNEILFTGFDSISNNQELIIPDGWEEIKLTDIFSFSKGKIPEKIYTDYSDGLEPYLTIEHLKGLNTTYTVKDEANTFVDNEVLMVMDGAASGEVYQGFVGVLGSTLSKLKIKKKGVSNELLFFIMKSLEKEIALRNTGSTVPHSNKEFINKVHIALPLGEKLDKLNKYAIYLRRYFLTLNEYSNEMKKLSSLLFVSITNNQITILPKSTAEDKN